MYDEIRAFLTEPGVLLVGACASILVLFVLSATNRVVVFADKSDFVWTAMIPIVPVIWLFGLFFSSGTEPLTLAEFSWAEIRLHPTKSAFMLFGAALLAFAVLSALFKSISFNGLVLGIVVFAFKIFASLFLMFIVPFTIFARSLANTRDFPVIGWFFYLIFGGIGYLSYLLINGNRVMARRTAA